MVMSETNITPEQQPEELVETWKFADGTEKPIDDLDICEVLICVIHSLKRIRYYGHQVDYFQKKIDATVDDEKQEDKYHYQKTRCNNTIYLFESKIDSLKGRAIMLGQKVPNTFDECKELLSELKELENVEN